MLCPVLAVGTVLQGHSLSVVACAWSPAADVLASWYEGNMACPAWGHAARWALLLACFFCFTVSRYSKELRVRMHVVVRDVFDFSVSPRYRRRVPPVLATSHGARALMLCTRCHTLARVIPQLRRWHRTDMDRGSVGLGYLCH